MIALAVVFGLASPPCCSGDDPGPAPVSTHIPGLLFLPDAQAAGLSSLVLLHLAACLNPDLDGVTGCSATLGLYPGETWQGMLPTWIGADEPDLPEPILELASASELGLADCMGADVRLLLAPPTEATSADELLDPCSEQRCWASTDHLDEVGAGGWSQPAPLRVGLIGSPAPHVEYDTCPPYRSGSGEHDQQVAGLIAATWCPPSPEGPSRGLRGSAGAGACVIPSRLVGAQTADLYYAATLCELIGEVAVAVLPAANNDVGTAWARAQGYAAISGPLLVASIGRGGFRPATAADERATLSVGALHGNGSEMYGAAKVDLMAPGEGLCTVMGVGYGAFGESSGAAAVAAGVAARIAMECPEWSQPGHLRRLLMTHAAETPALRIDGQAALQACREGPPEPPP